MGETHGVGFVGLGQIGHPMAARLTDVSGGLTVFDVEAATAGPLIARGATMASSVTHLAELCDVVCVAVPDDAAVRSVVTEALFAARPGTIILVHSTIRPETAVELAREAAVLDVQVLDAAVTGGASAAEQGKLAILVGGPEEAFTAVLPVLERMGDLVLLLGDVGAGATAKLARSLLQHVAITAAAEASRLAETAGINPAVLGHIVRHTDGVTGGPGAVMWRETTAPMAPEDPWRPVYGRIRTLAERELHLAVELASQLGVDTPLADLALHALGSALGFGPERTGAQGREGARPKSGEEAP